MRKQIPKIIIYILLLLTVFIAYQLMMKVDSGELIVNRGVADPSEHYDMSRERARIHAIDWEYYPEHLYTPEDFASGNTIEPIYSVNENPAAFGTYRVTVHLPTGKTYGMAGRSFLFSQRTFINDEMAGEIGSPGTTAKTTVPRTSMYTYYFTPQTDKTEIIFQVSDFQMADGGGAYSFSIGEAPMIQSFRLHRQSGSLAVTGCLVMVALLFAGMFIFFSRRRYFLWYAMIALMIAVRGLFIGDKPIMEFMQNLNWYTAIRIEYVSLILIVVFAVLYFRELYRNTMPKPVFYTLLGISAVYALLVLVTEPLFFSIFNFYYAFLWVITALWVLMRLAMGIKKGGVERLFVFIGLLCFVAAAVNDQIQYTFTFYPQFENSITVGMLLFVFMNMLALLFGFVKTETALHESTQKSEILAAKAALYTKMNHDIRTPLTAISNYAQLITEQLREGKSDEQTIADMKIIRSEAERLADMASNALHSSEGGNDPETLDMTVIARQMQGIFCGQMKFSGRTLTAAIPNKLPPIWGSASELTRLLWNLLDNAVKHSGHGAVHISAVSDGDIVTVSIADEGVGIAPELLPKIFDSGVSGTGGTGLGLPICREIARKYHGDVTIESEPGKGTTAMVTLPVYYGGKTDE